jgi:hypothetical protein
VQLHLLPGVAADGQGQPLRRVGEHAGPGAQRPGRPQGGDDGGEAGDALREPPGQLDVAALHVVVGDRVGDEAEVLVGDRDAGEQPLHPEPPGVDVDAAEVVALAVGGVEAPADAEVGDPGLDPGEVLVGEPEPAPDGGAAEQVEDLGAGQAVVGEVEQLADDLEHRVGLAQRPVGDPHPQRRGVAVGVGGIAVAALVRGCGGGGSGCDCRGGGGHLRAEHRVDVGGEGLDVRAHHDDVARLEVVVGREQVQDGVAQHLDLPQPAVGGVDLHGAVVGGEERPRSWPSPPAGGPGGRRSAVMSACRRRSSVGVSAPSGTAPAGGGAVGAPSAATTVCISRASRPQERSSGCWGSSAVRSSSGVRGCGGCLAVERVDAVPQGGGGVAQEQVDVAGAGERGQDLEVAGGQRGQPEDRQRSGRSRSTSPAARRRVASGAVRRCRGPRGRRAGRATAAVASRGRCRSGRGRGRGRRRPPTPGPSPAGGPRSGRTGRRRAGPPGSGGRRRWRRGGRGPAPQPRVRLRRTAPAAPTRAGPGPTGRRPSGGLRPPRAPRPTSVPGNGKSTFAQMPSVPSGRCRAAARAPG